MTKIGMGLLVIATLGASTMGMNTAQAASVAISGQLVAEWPNAHPCGVV